MPAGATTIGHWWNRYGHRVVRVGWEHLSEMLEGQAYERDLLQIEPDPPQWATVDVSRMRLKRLRSFGDVFLGLALWRRLKLDGFFDEVMAKGREDIPWSAIACILTMVRFGATRTPLRDKTKVERRIRRAVTTL